MSYCDCGDYDRPEFYNIEHVRARKPHVCLECDGPIEIGHRYKRLSGKWEGYVETFHICVLCEEMKEWAEISVPCFCSALGELHERVREMVADVHIETPGFLFEWGRRAVKIRQRGGQP